MLWVTPFAGPVLPDVKKIAAGASGARRRRDPSRRRRSSINASSVASVGHSAPSGSPYVMTPIGSVGPSRVAAMSALRSTCTTSADAPLTSSVWSISGVAYR